MTCQKKVYIGMLSFTNVLLSGKLTLHESLEVFRFFRYFIVKSLYLRNTLPETSVADALFDAWTASTLGRRYLPENTAFLLRLGLPVHTNPSRKRSFLKTLFKPKKFENASFAF